jgi:hypothetical protein
MIDAFMEGRHSAKHGKTVLDNPYSRGLIADPFKANLWESGFMHWLEEASAAAIAIEAEEMKNAR